MKRYFTIDWSDHFFPEIREAAPDGDEKLTLAQAKQQVRAQIQSSIAHWKGQMERLKSLKQTDIPPWMARKVP